MAAIVRTCFEDHSEVSLPGQAYDVRFRLGTSANPVWSERDGYRS